MKVSDGYSFSLDTFSVTVNPLPTVAAITGANNVCVLASTLLNDVSGSGTWSASNTNASIGLLLRPGNRGGGRHGHHILYGL